MSRIILLVPTNLLSVSEAASHLGIGRDAVLMAVGRGKLKPEHTVTAPNGKVVAHLFTQEEVDRYATGRRSNGPSKY